MHGSQESIFNNDIYFVIKLNNEAKFNYYATQAKTKTKTKHEWKLIQHCLSMLFNIESTIHRAISEDIHYYMSNNLYTKTKEKQNTNENKYQLI